MFIRAIKKIPLKFASLRWQLGTSYALLVLVVTALLTGIAIRTAAAVSLEAQIKDATASVEGAAVAFIDSLTKTNSDPSQIARQLGLAAGGRIIWLGEDNRVKVDGDGDAALNGKVLPLPDDFKNLEKPQGKAYSAGEKWVVYAVSPLEISNKSIGKLLFIRSLENLQLELKELQRRLWLTGAILALVFTVVGSLFASNLSKPIEGLKEAVRRMEKGELNQSVAVEGSTEIASLSESFNEMAHKVSELDKQRRLFIANAAHELRTPLAALRAIAEGMEYDGEEVKVFIKQIERLSNLVNSLLTLARLDNPQLKLNQVPIRVINLIEEVLWTVKPLLEGKNITFSTKKSDTEIWVYGDPDWLHQALVNILDNAIRYTPEGGTIKLNITKDTDLVQISVEDSGIGVPPEALAYLGNRFYRTSPSRDRQSGGAGLGLSIVKEILHLHGGDVHFSSPPGRGLIVKLVLQKAPPEV